MASHALPPHASPPAVPGPAAPPVGPPGVSLDGPREGVPAGVPPGMPRGVAFVVEASSFAGRGGLLHRRAVRPADPAVPWATLALVHGYGDHSGRHLHFLQFLAAHGVSCYAVDLRGQGKSQGRRGYVRRWEEYLDDLDGFVASLDPERGGTRPTPPLFLLGHSHGGLVAAAHALAGGAKRPVDSRDPGSGGGDASSAGGAGVGAGGGHPAPRGPALPGMASRGLIPRGLILSAPFFRNAMSVPGYKVLLARLVHPFVPWLPFATGVGGEMLCSDPQMLRDTAADALVTRVATPRWYLTHRAVQRRVMRQAGELTVPLLVLLGEADPIADPSAGRAFFESAGSPDKTLRTYPGLLHEILRERQPDRQRVFADILAWMWARGEKREAALERRDESASGGA